MMEVEIYIDEKENRIRVPESFDEILPKRFLRSAFLFFQKNQAEFKIKTLFFCLITGFKFSRFAKLFKLSYNDEDTFWNEGVELITLIEAVDPLFEKITLEKSKIKRYGLFFGPSDRLKNMKLKQYRFSDPFFTACMENDLKADLVDELICHLYRPFNLPFSDKLLRISMWFVKRWKPEVKLAMLLNYMGLRNGLATEYPALFSGSSSDADFDPLWVQKMIYDMPSDKFGNLEAVENLSVPEAFDYLEYIHEKNTDNGDHN